MDKPARGLSRGDNHLPGAADHALAPAAACTEPSSLQGAHLPHRVLSSPAHRVARVKLTDTSDETLEQQVNSTFT